jgi:hypothetical protein
MEMIVNGVCQKKNNGSKILMKKVMLTIISGVNGMYIVDFLPDGEPYNSEYFGKHILNRLYERKTGI